jgi:GT2 family glycosyltransferase
MSATAAYRDVGRAPTSATVANPGTSSAGANAGEPDLSVIVVTHNRAELALATLGSAHAAAGGVEVEWLVVDSGSSDGTPAAIEAAHPGVRVLREGNIGFAAANNRALALARGRYVLLLNPDVTTASGTFAELLAHLDRHPEIGMASVVQNSPDGSLQYSIRRFPSAWLALGEALGVARWRLLRGWREEDPREGRYRASQSADWLVGAFLIARGEAVQAVGGLDERFFLYSEEIDWCYRFKRAGWDVRHLPTMTVTHHTGEERPADLMAQLSYAKVLFARKHYSPARALAIQAAHALRHALRAAVGALPPARKRWAGRAAAERRALAVLLGRAAPPFGAGAGASRAGAAAEVLQSGVGAQASRAGAERTG